MKIRNLLLLLLLLIYSCKEDEILVETTPVEPPRLTNNDSTNAVLSPEATGIVIDIVNTHATTVFLLGETGSLDIPTTGYNLTMDENKIYHLTANLSGRADENIYIPISKPIDSIEIKSGNVYFGTSKTSLGQEHKPKIAENLTMGMKSPKAFFKDEDSEININNLSLYFDAGSFVWFFEQYPEIVGTPINRVKLFYSEYEQNNYHREFYLSADSIYINNQSPNGDASGCAAYKYVTGDVSSKPFTIGDKSCFYGIPLEVDPKIANLVTIQEIDCY